MKLSREEKQSFYWWSDASTGYILFMQWIPQRTKGTILAALMPLEALFRNVEDSVNRWRAVFSRCHSRTLPTSRASTLFD